MPANEIHVGDIGTRFIVTVKDGDDIIDISSATTKNLIFRKPDGTLLTKAASFYTDGTDGILTYSTVSGDLEDDGFWKLQGYLVITGGTWYTDIHDFNVHRNL